jgi:hypothetical protein
MINKDEKKINKPLKKIFILKGFEPYLYRWSPIPNDYSKASSKILKEVTPYFCNALPGTQGEDWITSYVSDSVIVDYKAKRIAYVECDYVE